MTDSKAGGPFPQMGSDINEKVDHIIGEWKSRLTQRIIQGLQRVLSDIDIRFGGKEMDAEKRNLLREQLLAKRPRFEEIMNDIIPRLLDECYGRA